MSHGLRREAGAAWGATGPVVALAFAATVALYVVALQLGAHSYFGASDSSINSLLADAFLHGRTNVAIPVPPELLALPDVHDPVANARFRADGLHDLSLFDGKLYPYWGPVPAVLMFLPFRAAGLALAQGHAVLLLAVLQLLAATALLTVLVRRHLPSTPQWMLAVGVIALGSANLAPYLLVRPLQYEVAIAAGAAFLMVALLLTAVGVAGSRVRLGAIAGASLAFGLASGSRISLAPAIVVLLAVVVADMRRVGLSPRLLAAAFVPFGLVFLALLTYNQTRFGTPQEFGMTWALTGANLPKEHVFSASGIVPNLWYYLAPPPLPRLQFPFLHANPDATFPFREPGSYRGADAVVGIAFMAPLVWLLPLSWRRLRGTAPALRPIVGGLVALGALVLVPLLILAPGPAAVRYCADFLPLLILAALLCWFALPPRRVLRGAGVAAVAWGAVVVAALSLANDGAVREHHPGAFRALERTFSPLPTTARAVAGGPAIAAVGGDAAGPPHRYDTLKLSGVAVVLRGQPVVVDVVSGSAGEATLTGMVAGSSPLTVRSARSSSVTVPGDGRRRIAVQLVRGITKVELTSPGDARVTDLRIGG